MGFSGEAYRSLVLAPLSPEAANSFSVVNTARNCTLRIMKKVKNKPCLFAEPMVR